MCSICQTMRKAIEEAGEVTKEEIDKLFLDAERSLKRVESNPKEDK